LRTTCTPLLVRAEKINWQSGRVENLMSPFFSSSAQRHATTKRWISNAGVARAAYFTGNLPARLFFN
jgi:hypothetical protein